MKNVLRIHLAVILEDALIFQSFVDLDTEKNNHCKITILADFISIKNCKPSILGKYHDDSCRCNLLILEYKLKHNKRSSISFNEKRIALRSW